MGAWFSWSRFRSGLSRDFLLESGRSKHVRREEQDKLTCPTEKSSAWSVKRRRGEPNDTLRAPYRATSPRRRNVITNPVRLPILCRFPLHLILLVIKIVNNSRLLVLSLPLPQQESQSSLQRRQPFLSSRGDQLSNRLEEEGPRFEGYVGVALEIDCRAGRLRVGFWKSERSANEERRIQRNCASPPCNMDLSSHPISS